MERVKKLTFLIILISALVLPAGNAKADLLGIESDIGYPRIILGAGTISFDDDYLFQGNLQNRLKLTFDDLWYIPSDGADPIAMTQGDVLVRMTIDLVLNDNLVIISDRLMTEKVTTGTLVIGDIDFTQLSILLQGNVPEFGWHATGDGGGEFDFLITNLSGGFVTAGLWPNDVSTGIFVQAAGTWDGDWIGDFSLTNGTGIKGAVSVPEPGILILLGISMVSIAGARRWWN